MSDEKPVASPLSPDEVTATQVEGNVIEAPATAPVVIENPSATVTPQDVVAPLAPSGGDEEVAGSAGVGSIEDAEAVASIRGKKMAGVAHRSVPTGNKTKTDNTPNVKVTKEAKPAEVVQKKVGAGKKVAGVFQEDAQRAEREAQKPTKAKKPPKPKDAGGGNSKKVAGVSQ